MTVEDVESIPRIVARRADERPTDVALVSERGDCTFEELHRSVTAVAAALRQLGVTTGTTVGLLCTNRIEWIVATFATVTAGGRVAAFNTWSQRWDLDHLLRHSRCEVLVSLSALRDRDLEPLLRELVPEAWDASGPGWRSASFPELRELVLIDSAHPPAGARTFTALRELGEPNDPSAGEPAAMEPGADVLVMYTSGSTARPKAVPLQHGPAVQHGTDVGVRMGITEQDRIWLPVPLFWSYGGANALMVATGYGCCLVLQEQFDAGQALDIIEEHRCTVAYTLPSITGALLAHPGFSANRVRSLTKGMTIGSRQDVTDAATALDIGEICNAYGSTELYGGCCVTPHDWPLERKRETQGPPLPGMAVRILDPESVTSLPAGETGEIAVRGQVTPGYLDQPDENARAFAETGEFRTGDLGYLDPDGNMHFVARASEMIRCGGINIAPAEVEEFLLIHPDVAEAVVVGAPDERKGEVAVAFVTIASGSPVDEQALRAHCLDGIASYKVPARIATTVDPLPRTTTGKIERRTLRERACDLWPARGDASESHTRTVSRGS